MAPAKVIPFAETTRTMTYAEGLAFIERTRRQLDRSGTALSHGGGYTIAQEYAGAIRLKLDMLERDFRKDTGSI